jgi:23S rRNA G2445 N2-methylase RlmL
MCGAGTLLAEHLSAMRGGRVPIPPALGGDIDAGAVRAAAANLRRLGHARLACWDAAMLPLPPHSVDRIICNPPFGKQLGAPEEIGSLYRRLLHECDRVLRPGGRAVLLAGDAAKMRGAAQAVGWRSQRQLVVRILGQPATVGVWQKGKE